MSQVEYIVDEFEQIVDAIGFDVIGVIVLEEVVAFLLLNYVVDDALEILPRSPDVDLTQLHHPLMEFCALDKWVHNFVVLRQASEYLEHMDSFDRGE